jgi:hypothetical protein
VGEQIEIQLALLMEPVANRERYVPLQPFPQIHGSPVLQNGNCKPGKTGFDDAAIYPY